MRRGDRWSLIAGELGRFAELWIACPVIRTWSFLVETLLNGRGPRSIRSVRMTRRWRRHKRTRTRHMHAVEMLGWHVRRTRRWRTTKGQIVLWWKRKYRRRRHLIGIGRSGMVLAMRTVRLGWRRNELVERRMRHRRWRRLVVPSEERQESVRLRVLRRCRGFHRRCLLSHSSPDTEQSLKLRCRVEILRRLRFCRYFGESIARAMATPEPRYQVCEIAIVWLRFRHWSLVCSCVSNVHLHLFCVCHTRRHRGCWLQSCLYHALVQPLLLLDPSLQRSQKGRDHVEAVFLDQVPTHALLHLVLPLDGGQVGEFVPVDFLDGQHNTFQHQLLMHGLPRSPCACAVQSTCPWARRGRRTASYPALASRLGSSSSARPGPPGQLPAGRSLFPRRPRARRSPGSSRPCLSCLVGSSTWRPFSSP